MLVAAAMLASCAGPPALRSGPHITVVEGNVLPPPDGAETGTSARPYRIGAFDKLGVSVFGVPELSQTVQVDASGRISLPLAGAIDASGKTPDELAAEIAQRLASRYVRNPQVTVNLEETVSQVVTIDGQVREPGLYPVVGRMTLMRAIATAKGTTEFARLQDVVVFRTVGQREMVALYNLQAIRRGLYPDPEVFASDVVVVGDSPARRLFQNALQAAPLLVTPIVALLQRN
jgi:polysaccharide export outer membrane protein